ncbi:MAG: CPBP family intramembrane glutamic endopeptidase [Candidatus Binataceae bacterium]
MSFTAKFVLALIGALLAAVIIAPIAAVVVAAMGFRFPFPRIFDRTVMVTLLIALIIFARQSRFGPLIKRAFRNPRRNFPSAVRGLIVALFVMAILFTCAALLGAHSGPSLYRRVGRIPGYVLSAIAVAIIEEGFFRAFLLGGMTSDFGRGGALAVSSAIYSFAHLVHAPAHFYVRTFEPLVGLTDLSGSFSRLTHPASAVPALIGLFLLGLVLGEAFLLSGTVYFSMGLHAGFVLGAKTWPMMLTPGVPIPHWLAGYPHFPLISGVAAWIAAMILLALLPALAGGRAWAFRNRSAS